MKLLSIQVGQPRDYGRPDATELHDKPWRTAFFKETIAGPVFAGRTHLDGDGQADLEVHGGPDKAINVYSKDHWEYWKSDLGLDLPHGAFGENFTAEAMSENEVCIGDIYRVGGCLVQVSQPRQPCWKLARRWRLKDLPARVERTGRTGWYFRVLEEGLVEAPAEFTLVDRPHPEWSIASANEVMYRRKDDAAATESLAQCPALAASWREGLSHRAAKLRAAS